MEVEVTEREIHVAVDVVERRARCRRVLGEVDQPESTRVGESLIVADGADEASIPAPQFPTDGANEEGVTSTIPMSRDPGFREGRRRWWTTRLDKTRGTIYPGSGPFVEGKTPTPACLMYYSARLLLQGLLLRLDLAQVF